MRKRIFILLIGFVMLASCGSDYREEDIMEQQEQTVQDSIPTLRGEFIFLADDAVLKGDDFIYGVSIDSTAMDLAEKIKPLKNEDFDMIPVVVKAKISKNLGREGWDEIIEIREVVEILSSKDSTQQQPSN